MDVLDPELCSGCESGWTLYLEHSVYSNSSSSSLQKDEKFVGNKRGNAAVEGEEEDLSMVSDASSGPPHFHEDDDYDYILCNGDDDGYSITHPPSMAVPGTFAKSGCKRQKKIKCRGKLDEEESFLLDDTASSPLFTFKSNGLIKEEQASMESSIDCSQSQGFSATHFQGRSALQESFDFVHPPLTRNQLQTNQW
ncbi:hypothetical protein Ancab_017596 [Ancistrocladus abbreviatus]